MGKFTGGLLLGGAIGAVALSCVMSDNRTRRKAMRSGRHAMDTMCECMDKISDML